MKILNTKSLKYTTRTVRKDKNGQQWSVPQVDSYVSRDFTVTIQSTFYRSELSLANFYLNVGERS